MVSIDFHRACTATWDRVCWLSSELTSWNQVLNPYGLNLTEVEPGNLALSTFQYFHGTQYSAINKQEHYTPSFFIAWLPRKHHCLRTLRLRGDIHRCPFPLFDGAAALIESAGPSSNLRELEVQGREYVQEGCQAMRASASSLENVIILNARDRRQLPPELAAFLSQAAHRVKKLSIRDRITDDRGMLSALLLCTELTDLTLLFSCENRVSSTIYQMLKQCRKLRQLTMELSSYSGLGLPDSLHKALAANTSLTRLHVVVHTGVVCRAVCDAVGHSSSLTQLRLSYRHPSQNCVEEPIASLLSKHTRLKTLISSHFTLCREHSIRIADGLVDNSGLQWLDVASSRLDKETVSWLAGALEKNSTVKKLKIGNFSVPLESGFLLGVLSAGGGRIEITPWTEGVVSTLAPTLTVQGACPQHLTLDASTRLSDETRLRAALQETRSVRTLTLHVTESLGPALGDALSFLLQDNKSITAVELKLNDTSLLSGALWYGGRPGAIHLWPDWPPLEPAPQNWHSYFPGETASAARSLINNLNCRCQGICSVALALRDSATVRSFEVGGVSLDFPGFDVSKTIARNLSLLNDASRFVTRYDVGKRCALAFETLATTPALTEHLRKVTGQSEAECECAVRAATGFLEDNFFVIAGVVQHLVACHPEQASVQFDELNAVGLRLVTRYLSVSDVEG